MQKLTFRADARKAPKQLNETHVRSKFTRVCAACALVTCLPMFEAYAQPPTPPRQEQLGPASASPQATPKAEVKTAGQSVTLTDGDSRVSALFVNKQTEDYPIYKISCTDTVALSFSFYPVVVKDWFKSSPEYPRIVKYKLTKTGGTNPEAVEYSYSGKTSNSSVQSSIPMGENLAVGSPLSLTVELGPGEYDLQFTVPNGFIRLVGVKEIKPNVVGAQVNGAKYQVGLPRSPTSTDHDNLSPSANPRVEVNYENLIWSGGNSQNPSIKRDSEKFGFGSHSISADARLGRHLSLGASGGYASHSLDTVFAGKDHNSGSKAWLAQARMKAGLYGKSYSFYTVLGVGIIRFDNFSRYADLQPLTADALHPIFSGDILGSWELGSGAVLVRLNLSNNTNIPSSAHVHLEYPLFVKNVPAELDISSWYFRTFGTSSDAKTIHLNASMQSVLWNRVYGHLPLFKLGPATVLLPVEVILPFNSPKVDSVHSSLGTGLGANLGIGDFILDIVGGLSAPIGNFNLGRSDVLFHAGLSYAPAKSKLGAHLRTYGSGSTFRVVEVKGSLLE